MKAYLVSFFILLTNFYTTIAQHSFTNQWINYDQPYYKIAIPQAGIYRLGYDQLKKAGISLETTPVERLALYYRGEEAAVRVVGEENGLLLPTGYLEFFAQGNTGKQDSLVYRPHSDRPPTNISLYGDESFYFLTVSSQQKRKRIQSISFQSSNIAPDSYHLERQTKEFKDEWSFNNSNGLVPYLQQSYYEKGESWTGKMIRSDSLATIAITLSNRVATSEQSIQFKALLNGRFDSAHRIDCSIGQRKFATLNFTGFGHQAITTFIQETEIDTRLGFLFKMKSQLVNPYEIYSLTSYEVIYPQRFEMGEQLSKYFYLKPNLNNQSVISIGGFIEQPLFYDITNPSLPQYLESQLINNRWQTLVRDTEKSRTLFVTSTVQSIPEIKRVYFNSYPLGANYLIITHKGLFNSAQKYAAYRQSEPGGQYQTLVADIEQLYDQYNYGERGPMGIRNFLEHQLSDEKKDKYLLLIGNGVSFPDVLKTWKDRDFVPTFGYPGSDVLLSAGLGNSDPNSPALRTGRLSATTSQEVLNYLNKVQEFERNISTLASKKLLHLNGGKSVEEITQLKNILTALSSSVQRSFLGGTVESISKRTLEPVENISISKQVNEGVGMITFMGHASPTVPDLNIGYASDPTVQLNNKAKYPFMYFNGCGVGNVFYRYQTLASDWLLSADKGAIGILSNSFWSYTSTSARYLSFLYQNLFQQEALLGKTIGEILQKTGQSIAKISQDNYDIANLHQMILLGDPSIVVFDISKPDYAFGSKGFYLQSTLPFAKTDSIQAVIVMTNRGKANLRMKFKVALKLTENDGTIKTLSYTVSPPNLKDTLFLNFKRPTSLRSISAILDAEHQIEESNETNNETQLMLDWETLSQSNVYPINVPSDRIGPTLDVIIDGRALQNGGRVSSTPRLEVLLIDDSPLSLDTSLVEIYLKSCESCNFQIISSPKLTYSLKSLNQMLVSYSFEKLEAGKYEILIQGKDVNGNMAASPYRIVFWVIQEPFPLSVQVLPNPSSKYAKFVYQSSDKNATEGILKIFSAEGKLVKEISFFPFTGENEIYWIDPPTSGMYTYKLTIGPTSHSGKLILY